MSETRKGSCLERPHGLGISHNDNASGPSSTRPLSSELLCQCRDTARCWATPFSPNWRTTIKLYQAWKSTFSKSYIKHSLLWFYFPSTLASVLLRALPASVWAPGGLSSSANSGACPPVFPFRASSHLNFSLLKKELYWRLKLISILPFSVVCFDKHHSLCPLPSLIVIPVEQTLSRDHLLLFNVFSKWVPQTDVLPGALLPPSLVTPTQVTVFFFSQEVMLRVSWVCGSLSVHHPFSMGHLHDVTPV